MKPVLVRLGSGPSLTCSVYLSVCVQAWCKKKKLQSNVTSPQQIPDVGRFFKACYEGTAVSVGWGQVGVCLSICNAGGMEQSKTILQLFASNNIEV